jgi:hypothetical protein
MEISEIFTSGETFLQDNAAFFFVDTEEYLQDRSCCRQKLLA